MGGWDVAVIGAGIGGLATAAHLAKHGIRTLVCERSEKPGGYFTSFTRAGYTFDAGIQGCENVGLLLPLLEKLGLRERIELKRSQVALALPGFFHRLQHYSELSLFYDHFKEVFPQESPALDRVKREAMQFCGMMDALLAPTGRRWRRLASLRQAPRFLRLLRTPIEEHLAGFIRDPRLVRLLSVGYRGNPTPLSLTFIPTMMDYYYPARGGMQAIPDLLARHIREQGGEVRCRAPVSRILVEGGRAAGVVLEDGELIRSRCVVNDSDLRRAYASLIPETERPKRIHDRLLASRLGDSVFSVYLGVDIRSEDLPTEGCPHVFLIPSYDPCGFSEIDTNPDFYSKVLLMVSLPTLLDPTLAPEGKSVVILQCAASPRSFGRWGTAGGERGERYRAQKREVAARLIANAEQLLPGLSRKIEVQVESTPLTLERFTLNSGGAATGWTYHPREAFRGGLKGILRSSNAGLENLYQVGHWTMSPGGAPAGFLTAMLASGTIRRRIRAGKL